jgi:hypothetical protein
VTSDVRAACEIRRYAWKTHRDEPHDKRIAQLAVALCAASLFVKYAAPFFCAPLYARARFSDNDAP